LRVPSPTGSQTVTPASMANIFVGAMLLVQDLAANSGANQEVVTVTAVTGTTFTAVFGSVKTAAWIVTPCNVPAFVESPYDQPIAVTQCSVSINGVAYALAQSIKLTVKGNRNPVHAIGNGTDMTRAEEGEFSVDFDIQARYVTSVGSLYQKYLQNLSPGQIIITAQDTTTVLQGTSAFPTFQLTIPLPYIESAEIDSMKAEDDQMIKGYVALDPVTQTNLKLLLTNQQKLYDKVS
jgi:hypothetical protein